MNLELKFTHAHGYHGAVWPPAPAQVYQALVKAMHEGPNRNVATALRDQTLEWLEKLPAPIIFATEAQEHCKFLNQYVPDNDHFAEHKRSEAKPLQVWQGAGVQHVTYVWDFDKRDLLLADAVTAMALLIPYLGRTVDLVTSTPSIQETSQPTDAQKVWYPTSKSGPWLVPAQGFLQYLRERYPRSAAQYPPSPFNSRNITYSQILPLPPLPPTAVFELLGNDGKAVAFKPARIREATGMIRHAMNEWIRLHARTSHYNQDRIAQLLLGHRSAQNDKPLDGPHFAIAGLPTINHTFADGAIRKFAVIGYGAHGKHDQQLFEELNLFLASAPLVDRGAIVGRIRCVSVQDTEKALAPYMHPTTHIRTVTPLILALPLKGRKPVAAVSETLFFQGLHSDNIISIAVQTGPLLPHTLHARAYRVGSYLSETERFHVEIIWRYPRRGILMLGRGRYNGFGLCYPFSA